MQTTINVRMETQTKKEMEDILKQIGLTTTAAFNMFAKALIHERKIPFNITIPKHESYEDYLAEMIDEADEELANNPTLHDADEMFAEMRRMINEYKKSQS